MSRIMSPASGSYKINKSEGGKSKNCYRQDPEEAVAVEIYIITSVVNFDTSELIRLYSYV